MSKRSLNDRAWKKVGEDRAELAALRAAAHNFLNGNTTEQAVAEFKAALMVNTTTKEA